MPTIDENRGRWSTYDWRHRGDEWSEVWGGTDYLWWGTIYPRILGFVPTGTVLEIAPGYGRCTHFLKDLCDLLIVVDLMPDCIDACRKRFRDAHNIRYFVNDGKSLDMVAAESVDFAFSFDSLVHVEDDVIHAYLSQLAEKLKPSGAGFFHHSNIKALIDPKTNRLPFENRHWRAPSVSAELFSEMCSEVGLQCTVQEVVNWGLSQLTDCFSIFLRSGSEVGRVGTVRENPDFMDEAQRLGGIAQLYGPGAKRG